jgi:hypothetical protein
MNRATLPVPVAALLTEAVQQGKTTRREILEVQFWAVLTGRVFLFNP